MVEPLKGVQLPQPWRGFIERLTARVNRSAIKQTGMAVNNVFVADGSGDLKDSGVTLPSGSLVDKDYVGERYITENLLEEAEINDNPYFYSEDLTDDGLFFLPLLSQGARGTLIVGSDEERADFSTSSTGTVNLIMSSSNIVANANTDGKFCIGTATLQNPVVVKNRLGSSKWVTLTLWWK